MKVITFILAICLSILIGTILLGLMTFGRAFKPSHELTTIGLVLFWVYYIAVICIGIVIWNKENNNV